MPEAAFPPGLGVPVVPGDGVLVAPGVGVLVVPGAGVLVVPGRFFEAPGSFRIGFGGELAKVEDALAGLGRALDRRSSDRSLSDRSRR